MQVILQKHFLERQRGNNALTIRPSSRGLHFNRINHQEKNF